MISWTLALTGFHIQILRSLKEDPSLERWHGLRTQVTQMRILVREGLVEYRGQKEPYRAGYTGPRLTKRGEFILAMIEQDIAKYLSVTKAKMLKLAVNQ